MLGKKTNLQLENTNILVFAFLSLFVIILIRSAWISDDAYITLRTVDNLYHGYGLTWNPGFRVQTYTHPLWMLILASIYFIEDNPYLIPIALSVMFTLISLYLLINKISLTATNSIVGILLLLSSKAFVDYSTSGLENPLTHLFYSIFAVIFLSNNKARHSVLYLALTASLGMLCRMDAILLFFPALVYIILLNRTKRDFILLILGFLPFVLWELFSLIYYGFLFPNTAYAKLNTGISSLMLIKQGILYILNSISRDPGSLFVVSLGIYASIKSKDWRKISLSLGIVLYLVYVIRIGGDFMAGRFISVLVLGAIVQIVNTELFSRNHSIVFATVMFVLIFIATPEPPLLYNAGDARQETGKMGKYNGIEDERRWYYWQTGLLTISMNNPMPSMAWAAEGKEAKERGDEVVKRGPIGVFGFFAGPTVHIVDWYALSDPLLARLPVEDVAHWGIGHFSRYIPRGYLETLESGKNHIADPNLAKYYEKLSIVVRGDLFRSERFIEIWRINTGYYQSLLDAYMSSHN